MPKPDELTKCSEISPLPGENFRPGADASQMAGITQRDNREAVRARPLRRHPHRLDGQLDIARHAHEAMEVVADGDEAASSGCEPAADTRSTSSTCEDGVTRAVLSLRVNHSSAGSG